jgi:hypothetical protein
MRPKNDQEQTTKMEDGRLNRRSILVGRTTLAAASALVTGRATADGDPELRRSIKERTQTRPAC